MFTDEDAPVALQRYLRLIKGFSELDVNPTLTAESDPEYMVVVGDIALYIGYHSMTNSFWLKLRTGRYDTELYTFSAHESWYFIEEIPACPENKLLEEVMEFIADYT